MYHVSAVRIENGVITTDFYAKVKTQKAFLQDRTIKESFPVTGWKFTTVHLVAGTQENGEGWAFHQ
jgi:hypothetical protein